MVGAIFCRGCGKKLNLDELTPDAFDDPPEAVGKKIARIAQRVIILVLVVGIAGLLAGLFWPADGVIKGELDETRMKEMDSRFKAIQTPSRKVRKVAFTSEEATAALNQALGLPGSATGNKHAQHVSVEFLSGGNLRAILKASLFGQIPMYTEVICRPEVTSPGSVTFTVLSAHAGKLPLPENLRQNAIKQFSSLFKSAANVNQAKQNVRSIAVGANMLTVNINVRK